MCTINGFREAGYKIWYFTFGCGQQYAGYVQPIYARTYMAARRKMLEVYGPRWSMQYDEEEWEAMKVDPRRTWPMDTEISPILHIEEDDII